MGKQRKSSSYPTETAAAVASVETGRGPRQRVIFETLLERIRSGELMPGDRLPTEAELAREFAASRSTIARALRDLKKQGLLNRQRRGGTSIAINPTNEIALFTPFARTPANLGYIGSQIYAHLSHLACERSDHLRLQLVRRDEEIHLDPILSAVTSLINQRVRGVFFYPHELPPEMAHFNTVAAERLTAAGIAVVCIDRDMVEFPKRSAYSLITYDNRRGGYLLTRHLIERGAKRIAFVTTSYLSSAASDRVRGYRDALEDAGMPFERNFIRSATLEQIDFAFCRAMMDEVKPDAIICKMDYYAALVGRYLLASGLEIGRNVRLAGFDDEPIAEMLQVPLTTIRFPMQRFAEASYERLLAQMNNPRKLLSGCEIIDVELVIRESTGP